MRFHYFEWMTKKESESCSLVVDPRMVESGSTWPLAFPPCTSRTGVVDSVRQRRWRVRSKAV